MLPKQQRITRESFTFSNIRALQFKLTQNSLKPRLQLIRLQAMNFDRQQSNKFGESKSKNVIETLTPMSLRQLERIISRNQGLQTLGNIAIIVRVINLKEMLGRTIVTVSDETGCLTIVKEEKGRSLSEEEYVKFILVIKSDRDEHVLHSVCSQRITDFNQIQYHQASTMMVAHHLPSLFV